jgi:hypothetical protein
VATKKRDYKQEYQNYQGTPEQIANRSARNKARREMADKGLVHKGDGKDVDHKTPLVKGGAKTAISNLRVQTATANRSFPRNKKAGMK